MTIVNRFNVNKQQVTLDPDIIENMSANDVSYDAYTQYDENTVGDKISDLEQEINGKEEIISIINQSRISKGWNLPSGKWKVDVSYISNPDLETTWQLFHYVNGVMGTKYIDAVPINDFIEVDIPLGSLKDFHNINQLILT